MENYGDDKREDEFHSLSSNGVDSPNSPLLKIITAAAFILILSVCGYLSYTRYRIDNTITSVVKSVKSNNLNSSVYLVKVKTGALHDKYYYDGLRQNMVANIKDAFGYYPETVTLSKNEFLVLTSSYVSGDKINAAIGKKPSIDFRKPVETSENYEQQWSSPVISGDDIESVEIRKDDGGYLIITVNFNSIGSRKFEKITSEQTGKQLGIFIENEFISAPIVREKISTGRADISSSEPADEQFEIMANRLKAAYTSSPVSVEVKRVDEK